MSTLKEALIAFRMKNGMSRKDAAGDASMTVDDYISTPADNYRFMADLDKKAAPAPAAPAASATPAPTPAAVTTSQPPKP
jgi:hypothetical protein